MREVAPAKVIAACMGLAGFSIALLGGLAVDNPTPDIVFRAVLALVACCFVGLLIGAIAERVIADHIKARLAEPNANPTPSAPAASTVAPGGT